jgi:hypothetical protein
LSNLTPIGEGANQNLQLSYISLAGDEVPAPTRENVHLLQHAADYQVCARNLRYSGIGDIVWGIILAVVGWSMLRANPLNATLFILAALLLTIGIWITAKPSPIGMIYDGVVYLILAGWNILVLYLNNRAGAKPFGTNLPIIIVAQIIWGVYRIVGYQKFARAAAMQPSAASLKWLGDLTKATLKTKSTNSPDVIQFTRNSSWSYAKVKGRLLPEIAVVVATKGNFSRWRDVQLAAKDDLEIVSAKKRLVGGWKVQLRLRGKMVKTQMPQDSLDKLRNWLQTPAVVAPTDPGTVGFATLQAQGGSAPG